MTKNLPGLCRDDRGGTIIEMALAAPVLATLLIGMVDISRATAVKLQTTQVAQRAIERLVSQPNVTDAILTAEAAAGAGVAPTAVTIDRFLECNDVRQTTACQPGQTYAKYVTITISKTYEPLLSSQFARTFSGKAGVRIQ